MKKLSERDEASPVDRFLGEVECEREGADIAWHSREQLPQVNQLKRLWGILGHPSARERLSASSPMALKHGNFAYRRWAKNEELSVSGPVARHRAVRWLWFLAAGVAALATSTGWYVIAGHTLGRGSGGEEYETLASQTREFTLPDGSSVTLGARTKVAVRYTATSRAIELEKGEALFTVAKNPTRPFVVHAGAGSITAIGTQFDVSRELDTHVDRVTVVVSEGAVEVAPRTSDQPIQTQSVPVSIRWSPARITGGQGFSYDIAGRQREVSTVDAIAASAWVDGRLEYRQVRFGSVIPRISRYSRKPIVLGDDVVRNMPFTGSVFAGHIDGWLRALPTVYPVEVTETPESIVIRARDDGAADSFGAANQ